MTASGRREQLLDVTLELVVSTEYDFLRRTLNLGDDD
jgi:hypothetical protein